jgi:hypothetical protein
MFKPLRLQTRRLFVVAILIITMPWPVFALRAMYLSIDLQAKRIADPDAYMWSRIDVAEAFQVAGSVSLCGAALFFVILFFVILARLWGSSEDEPK